LREEFLRRYHARMTQDTRVFETIPPVLEQLGREHLAWGIVTNKAAWLAEPLVAALGFAQSAATIVCGDTTPFSKPHPEPLLEAARRIGIDPGDCIYVGDDRRDVDAGRAAGMATVVAAWGYLGVGEPVHAWGADAVIDRPHELMVLLEKVREGP
jgi:phosphoglycolate phosphatase